MTSNENKTKLHSIVAPQTNVGKIKLNFVLFFFDFTFICLIWALRFEWRQFLLDFTLHFSLIVFDV